MELIILAAILVCPVVMGGAMLLMWREMRHSHAAAPDEEPQQPEETKASRA